MYKEYIIMCQWDLSYYWLYVSIIHIIMTYMFIYLTTEYKCDTKLHSLAKHLQPMSRDTIVDHSKRA